MNGSFDLLRAKLERQYENAQFDPVSGWSEAQLRDAWAEHRQHNPDEPRILARASLTKLLFEHAPVALEEWNPFPGKLQLFGMLREDLGNALDLARKHVPGWNTDWNMQMELGCGTCVDFSHVAPDWDAVLRLGIPGLIERARAGNSDLHRAVVMVYEALAEFCRRVGRLNRNPAMERIADHKPETLYEAFLLAYVVHDAIENTNEEVRSMGKFDELYLDFYRHDLANGTLTKDSAKE